MRTLNLSEVSRVLRPKVALERALLLKEVLDRVPLPPFEAVPGAPTATESAEAGPTARSETVRWTVPYTEITIARVEEGPRAGEYLFTPETVASVRGYYEKVRQLPYRTGASAGFYELVHAAPGLLPPKWFEWIRGLPDWTGERDPTVVALNAASVVEIALRFREVTAAGGGGVSVRVRVASA